MTTIEDRLECIEQNQKVLIEKMTDLNMAVIGSNKIGVEGLISKVNKHEKYIEGDRKQKWLIAGAAGVISFIVTLIITFYEKVKF